MIFKLLPGKNIQKVNKQKFAFLKIGCSREVNKMILNQSDDCFQYQTKLDMVRKCMKICDWQFVNPWGEQVFKYLDWYLSYLAIQTPRGLQMEPWKLHLKQFEEISIFPERTVWRSPCECGHKFEQLSGGKNIWNLILNVYYGSIHLVQTKMQR